MILSIFSGNAWWLPRKAPASGLDYPRHHKFSIIVLRSVFQSLCSIHRLLNNIFPESIVKIDDM